MGVKFKGFEFIREIIPIVWKYYLEKIDYPDKPYKIYLSVLTDHFCLYDETENRMFEINTGKDLSNEKISEKLFLACDDFKQFMAG